MTFRYASPESLLNYSLETILRECDEGAGILGDVEITEREITHSEARALAVRFGSDEEFFPYDDEEEDDGERLDCERCGESFNVNESGHDTDCAKCAPTEAP